jgi:hypothetical protein
LSGFWIALFTPTFSSSSAKPAMAQRAGQVQWKRVDLFTAQPMWPSEPSIDAVQTVVQRNLQLDFPVDIQFLAQGACSKLYTIRITSEEPECVLRVTLPVDPHFKTESEVATEIFS